MPEAGAEFVRIPVWFCGGIARGEGGRLRRGGIWAKMKS